MAINLGDQVNIDKSDLANYPNGQIQDNDGTDNGTPINRVTSSDLWMFFDKLMRQAGLSYNGDFDNEGNGYQYVDALIALASKSDYILPLTLVSGRLSIPTKLGILQDNEMLLAQAAVDFTTETQFVGTDSPVVYKTIINTQNWKTGDFLLLINTPAGIKIIELVTGDNISVVGGTAGFLKKTSQGDEDTGTTEAFATTPKSNKAVFALRVNGADSGGYLATPSQNGLLSSTDKAIIDALVNPVRNVGYFTSASPGNETVGATKVPTGQITSVTVTGNTATSGQCDSTYRVIVPNTMTNITYFVRIHLQSVGTMSLDNDICAPIFKVVNPTTFDIGLQSTFPVVQNFTVWLEVVKG